jgi:hypothetical protein
VNQRLSKRNWLALVALMSGVLLAIFFRPSSPLASEKQSLKEIQSVETLRAQFNREAGKTRLILLLSPTLEKCQAGASWVQTQLLKDYPSEQLNVYVVWLQMYPSVSREKWDETLMSDPRVKHFWDGELDVARWFAKQVDGYEGVSWDTYYLYGPEAVWKTIPAPLASSGGPIYPERDKLRTAVGTLLEK